MTKNGMTPEEALRIKATLGLSSAKLGELLGMGDWSGRTVRRWTSGESKISPVTAMLLRKIEAEHGTD